MTTDKNKEQFEKWCKKLYIENLHFRNIWDAIGFDNLPFEMQIGVYLAYYDSIDIRITIQDNISSVRYNQSYEVARNNAKWGYYLNHENFASFKENTRNEAYKEAFKKANEIVNKS